jgi:hypothetical protein
MGRLFWVLFGLATALMCLAIAALFEGWVPFNP